MESRLNDSVRAWTELHNNIVRQYLAQSFIHLCTRCLTSEPLTELRFYHVERGFDVRSFVIVR
jgi:hypothetical protein